MLNLHNQSRSTSPPAHYDYHCFISYTTREDEIKKIKPFVDEYVRRLQAQGVTVCPIFYDGWYLQRPHYDDQELARLLRKGIERSAFSVCFLSPGYYESPWCIYEWGTTGEVHSGRGYPAQKFSILPICWKRISIFKHFEQQKLAQLRAGKATWAYRLAHREVVHICNSLSRITPDNAVTYGASLLLCVNETFDYLNRWYPQQGWLSKTIPPRRRSSSNILL